MEPDPIGLEGGLNPYAYAGNNPVNRVDPTGLAFEEISNLSSTWMSNVSNYILAMPSVISSDYSWSKPDYGNMSITTQQRNNFNNTQDYKALYVDRWETNHDPVARTSAIGWQQTTSSMNVQPWENAAAAVTWGSMEAYLQTQGYSSTSGSLGNKMNSIGVSVATEYIKAVDADKSGVPGLLSPSQVQQYHYAAFKQQGIPTGLFGGNFGGMLGASAYSSLWCRYCDK